MNHVSLMKYTVKVQYMCEIHRDQSPIRIRNDQYFFAKFNSNNSSRRNLFINKCRLWFNRRYYDNLVWKVREIDCVYVYVTVNISFYSNLASYSCSAGVSSRDLSPVDYVREYWSDCKDEMVEDMERIYVRYVICLKYQEHVSRTVWTDKNTGIRSSILVVCIPSSFTHSSLRIIWPQKLCTSGYKWFHNNVN